MSYDKHKITRDLILESLDKDRRCLQGLLADKSRDYELMTHFLDAIVDKQNALDVLLVDINLGPVKISSGGPAK